MPGFLIRLTLVFIFPEGQENLDLSALVLFIYKTSHCISSQTSQSRIGDTENPKKIFFLHGQSQQFHKFDPWICAPFPMQISENLANVGLPGKSDEGEGTACGVERSNE